MDTKPIKAQITVTWQELYQLGIEGLLKGDTVFIRELDHHTSSEFGTCALVVNIQDSKEWVIPIIYLKITGNDNQKDNRAGCTRQAVELQR